MLNHNINSTPIQKNSQRLQNQSGLAIFELIPMLVMFGVLCSYTFGFFSAVHSGILTSIAARNYAFETFRHRSNLTYFRGNSTLNPDAKYRIRGVRFHAITNPGSDANDGFRAPVRNISFDSGQNKLVNNSSAAEEYHNEEILESVQPGKRFNLSEGVNPIWLQIQYGICITAACGLD